MSPLFTEQSDHRSESRAASERYIKRKLPSEEVLRDLRQGGPVSDCPLRIIRDHPSGQLLGECCPCSASTILMLVIGNLSLQCHDKDSAEKIFEIGFSLLETARGTGIAQAALIALIEGYAIPILGLKTVSAVRPLRNQFQDTTTYLFD